MALNQQDGQVTGRGVAMAVTMAMPLVTGLIATGLIMIGLSACGVASEQPLPVPTMTVPASAEGPLVVQRVVDGDTVRVLRDGATVKLRLIGIDTPETVDSRKPVQCFGREASTQAQRLLEGAEVFIENDPSQDATDRYGRELVYLWRSDGLFFNFEMVASGYALENTYDLPYAYQAQFRAAQRDAEEGELGLWDSTTCDGDVEQPAR